MTAPRSTSGSERIEQKLIAQAHKKVVDKQQLSRAEKAALKRFEKNKEERLRWQHYGSIPQKHWRKMSGRQTKGINEQANRYGLPFGGPTIDLSAVVRGLHDFLAENAQKLAAENDPLMTGSGSPALERYREERAAMARLDRLERERVLVRRDEARTALGRIAAILRGAGETLQRQFGAAAVEIMYEALDDAGLEIERAFGNDADSSK